jgi:hypothetical protein
MNQMCIKEYVSTVEDVLRNWPLFHEGWLALRRPDGARAQMSACEFLQKLLHISSLPEGEGAIIIFKSKNGKPLGFTVVVNDSETLSRRTLLIYAAYSNGKYVDGPREHQYVVELWALQHNYIELHAQSPRMNGSAQRFFERKLGFHPACIVYKKVL